MRCLRLPLASLLLALVTLALGCNGAGDAPAPVEPDDVVIASTHPLAWAAGRIVGDAVPVHCPVPEGADPALWNPGRDDLAALQRGRVIALNGADLEAWVQTASLPMSRVVDTSAGFRDVFLRYLQEVSHSHGPAGDHTHAGIDGHTWVDPILMREQVGALRDALCEAWPEHATDFQARAAALQDDLAALDARFAEVAPLLEGRPLLAAHRAYDYPARRLKWTLINLDLDPAGPLDTEGRAALEAAVAESPPAALLWGRTPNAEIAEACRALTGAPNIPFSTGARRPAADAADEGDYLALQHANLDRLLAALQP